MVAVVVVYCLRLLSTLLTFQISQSDRWSVSSETDRQISQCSERGCGQVGHIQIQMKIQIQIQIQMKMKIHTRIQIQIQRLVMMDLDYDDDDYE